MAMRVGLVGAGGRAREVYAPALAACSDVEFAAVWARSADAVRRLADRHGTAACAGFDELVERCEAVVFAVPPAAQEEYAARAARRHRALLLEKPIGADIAGAEELTATALRERVPTTVALPWRSTTDVRRFLDEDVPAAEPVGGTGRLLTGSHAQTSSTPAWRLARGVLRDQAADLLDVLEAALGPIAGLHARGQPRAGRVGLLIDHQAGRFSQASIFAGRVHGPDVALVEVNGPRGTAEVEALGGLGPEAYERMVAEFARAVTGAQPDRLDISHGLHLQRLVEAAETDLVLHE
jgi:predicted dehydrogenase